MPSELRQQRQRSIRVLLTVIFIVPLVSLVGLWGFAASVTASNAIQEHNFNSENQMFGGWAQALFTQLAQERQLAYEWLSSGGRTPGEAQLLAQQHATDVAAQAFTRGLNANSSQNVSSAGPAIQNFNDQLASLTGTGGIRGRVDSRTVSALTALTDYDTIIDASFTMYSELVVVKDTPLYIQASASVDAGRSVEMAGREVTLLSGALFSGGKMGKAERVLFAQTVASRKLLMSDALSKLNPSCGSGYRRVEASAAYRTFVGMENQVIGSISGKGPIHVNALTLAAATLPLFKDYQAAQTQDRNAVSSLGTQRGGQLLEQVALAGGAGLVAVALSIVLILGFGRRISRELRGLQKAALELAQDSLPRVVSKLSQGEDVDVAAEATPIAGGRIAETARVAEAFSSVQRTAVEAAVGQARLRRGVSQVFRNLAWRSQSLLHRQLALLDAMERKQTEPETLDELFQLDHLTTRMRRHAEGLIILSGATPGRGWREPVPVIDVLRGAIAEVEEYKRVSVLCNSNDAIVGTAVADVIHLLAELIENATTYSPASTEVTVRAERVANGFVAEIEDRGIGVAPQKLAVFNERLASPPEFDLADSNRLGLFVVGRLASKHQITVTLRSSPYGGTAAIVLMPHSIVVARDLGEAEALAVVRQAIEGNGLSLAPLVGSMPSAEAPDLDAGVAGKEEKHEPAVTVTSGGNGTENFAVVDSAPAASEAGAAVGGNGGGSDSSLGAAWDPTNRGAPTYGRHEAPPARDLNARDSAWEVHPSTPAWERDHGALVSTPGIGRPALPRRHRQESLAPELKDDDQAADGHSDSEENLSPAGTRALVESLQHGFDRATATPMRADDSRPAEGTVESSIIGEDGEDL